ncbi:hypothetical protein D5E69_14360 [Rossellomorea marisflavi]|uniref:hypothetical protein n=1 Tax=Rossellomorea marisflavi TaxID=189381 RepID=UPI00131771F3|nr:hypothetical protein [Rossellomorea marisflavi]QHA36882.1 hypothetical protein D5E69_14360 [Rossellomorea marisflavi]
MQKIPKLIEKLLEETNNADIRWSTISNKLDPDLDSFIEYSQEYMEILKPLSYNAIYKGGEIFILSFADFHPGRDPRLFDVEYLILLLKSPTGRRLVPLNTKKEHQSELFRLMNSIDMKINDIDGFIDSILDDI